MNFHSSIYKQGIVTYNISTEYTTIQGKAKPYSYIPVSKRSTNLLDYPHGQPHIPPNPSFCPP